MNSSYITKRQYANNSFLHNLRNPLFVQLFKKEIKENQSKGETLINKPLSNEDDSKKV